MKQRIEYNYVNEINYIYFKYMDSNTQNSRFYSYAIVLLAQSDSFLNVNAVYILDVKNRMSVYTMYHRHHKLYVFHIETNTGESSMLQAYFFLLRH